MALDVIKNIISSKLPWLHFLIPKQKHQCTFIAREKTPLVLYRIYNAREGYFGPIRKAVTEWVICPVDFCLRPCQHKCSVLKYEEILHFIY